MSNKAITWAYGRNELKSGPKFVLVTLADMADQEHSCYPGVLMLAGLTGFRETAVGAHIKTLLLANLITKERRYRKDGTRTSNRYYLKLEAPARLTPESGDSSGGTNPGIRGLSPLIAFNPQLTPSSEPSDSDLMVLEPFVWTVEMMFEQFWQWYPRHEGKKPALAKFLVAAKKVPANELVSHAIAYRKNPNRNQDVKFVPLASTWLHQERWNDEIPEQSAAPPRRLTNTEQALADYAAEYGEPDGRTTVTPALDPGLSDRPAHG